MAATPVGKQAEEFKFFCPLCMMFYRTMREMPCCQQHTSVWDAPPWLCHRQRAMGLNSWGWPASILAPNLAPTRTRQHTCPNLAPIRP